MKRIKKPGVYAGAALLTIFFSILLFIPIAAGLSKTTLVDFEAILSDQIWFYPKFFLSLFYALAIAAGGTLVAFITAFSLVNGRFRCRGVLLFLLLLLMLMPLQTTLLPNYIGLRDLHLLDTVYALILPMLCSPFAIFLMVQYMSDVAETCVEAARLETNSLAVILFRIMLPQMKGSVAAVFLFLFAEGFNMVEQPLYYLRDESLRPLSVAASSLVEDRIGMVCAVGLLCLIPITFLYMIYNRILKKESK